MAKPKITRIMTMAKLVYLDLLGVDLNSLDCRTIQELTGVGRSSVSKYKEDALKIINDLWQYYMFRQPNYSESMSSHIYQLDEHDVFDITRGLLDKIYEKRQSRIRATWSAHRADAPSDQLYANSLYRWSGEPAYNGVCYPEVVKMPDGLARVTYPVFPCREHPEVRQALEWLNNVDSSHSGQYVARGTYIKVPIDERLHDHHVLRPDHSLDPGIPTLSVPHREHFSVLTNGAPRDDADRQASSGMPATVTTNPSEEEPTVSDTNATPNTGGLAGMLADLEQKAADYDNMSNDLTYERNKVLEMETQITELTEGKDKIEAAFNELKGDYTRVQQALDSAATSGSNESTAALEAEIKRLTNDLNTIAHNHGDTDSEGNTVVLRPPTVSEQVQAWFDSSAATPIPTYLPGKLDKKGKGVVWLVVKRGKPILLAGPSGTGKTEMAQNLFAEMHGRWLQVNFSGDSSKAQLIARTGAMAGQTYPVVGPIIASALGGIPLIADELGHGEAGTLSSMHELVRAGRILVEELNEVIVAKAPWTVIATDNGVGDDTGMYSHARIEATFLDRFDVKRVDYPTKARERDIILKQVPTFDKAMADRIAETFAGLRRLDHASCPFTVRKAVGTAKWIDVFTREDGMKLDKAVSEAVDLCITHRLPPDEHASVQEVVQRFLNVDTTETSDENSYNFSEFDAAE